MKIDKEQKNQFILLVVLLILVVGFGVYRMIGTTTSASPPVAETSVTDDNPPAQTTGTVNGDPGVVTVEQTAGYVNPVKDPFQPQVLASDLPTEDTKTVSIPRMPIMTSTPTMSLPPMTAFNAQPAVSMPSLPSVQSQEVDPTRDLRLTGVIEGDVNVAIIRNGDGRHIVREGQRMDGGLVVRSISRTGVRLTCNGRSYFLPLSSGSGKST